MPDPNDPVAEAKNEIAELKEREHKLQKQIDNIEENIRAAYDDNIDGFHKNPLTGEISYIGTDKDTNNAFNRLADLKDQLKITQKDLSSARETLKDAQREKVLAMEAPPKKKKAVKKVKSTGSSTSTTSSVASRLSALEKEFAALNRTLNGTIMTLINDREVEGRTNKGGQKSGVIPPLFPPRGE